MEDIVIAFMVITNTVVGSIGSVPQIIKTYKIKKVKDMSMTSWAMWSISSLAYLIYALLVNSAYELIFTSALDTLFNLIILLQIIYYTHIYKNDEGE